MTAQVKASIGSGGTSRPADWKKVIGILRDSGYRGWVALEYEEEEDARTAVPRLLQDLDALTR